MQSTRLSNLKHLWRRQAISLLLQCKHAISTEEETSALQKDSKLLPEGKDCAKAMVEASDTEKTSARLKHKADQTFATSMVVVLDVKYPFAALTRTETRGARNTSTPIWVLSQNLRQNLMLAMRRVSPLFLLCMRIQSRRSPQYPCRYRHCMRSSNR